MPSPPDIAHAGLAAMERLRRIAEAARGTDDGEWLAAALEVYETTAPAGIRFDETIHLTPRPGQQPWWAAQRQAGRDAAIRRLAATFPGSPSSRSAATADEMRRYGSTGWRHDRARGGPMTSDERRKLLYAIFSADEDPPTSVRRVYDIVVSR